MDTHSNASRETMFCMACGAELPIHAKFCAGCGKPAPVRISGEAEAASSQLDEADADMEAGNAGEREPMSLGMAWGVYLSALGIFWLFIAFGWYSPLLMMYLGAGFIMSKVIMGSLIEWHPVNNTISNVFSAKVGMFFLWPLRMGVLLIQLSINKAL